MSLQCSYYFSINFNMKCQFPLMCGHLITQVHV